LKNVELVERDQLDLATRELELSACFGAEQAAQRLRLGQLLKADALLLVSVTEHEQRKFLRLAVSDCVYGARLATEYLVYDPGRRAELAGQCATILNEVGTRFDGGIKHLIGVAPFLSKCLVHDYDHLQTAYATLLATTLMRYPGVAVVEIEEARAIAAELRLTAGQLRRRVVPLLLDGQFDVVADKPGDPPQVRLVVRLSDGSGLRATEQSDGLSLDETRDRLVNHVAPKLVDLSADQATRFASPAQQYAFLHARAEAFSQVGAFEHATALREAALLLQPNDAEERLALIGDYRRWLYREQRAHQEQNRKLRADERPTNQDDQFAHLRLLMHHAESVVRQQAVNPGDAAHLVQMVFVDVGQFRFVNLSPEQLDELHRFFWTICPQLPDLPYGLRQPAIECCSLQNLQPYFLNYDPAQPKNILFGRWTEVVVDVIVYHFPLAIGRAPGSRSTAAGSFVDKWTLDDLYRFLAEVVRSQAVRAAITKLFGTQPYDLHGLVSSGRITVD
jgi:hypothetical protein